MKKHLITILLTSLMSFNIWAQSNPVIGTVQLNGIEIPAEYTISGETASLGSGRNACIPHYSKGRVIVPATITVNGSTYNVTAVSSMAFRFCEGVSFVQLPEGVTHIDDFAFKGCIGLVDIILPSTLEHIGTGAFIGLDKLRAIYCQAETPPQWEYNDVFTRHEGGIGSTETYRNGVINLYVPMSKVEEYNNSTFSDETLGWTTPDGWKYFMNVRGENDYEAEWGIGISTPRGLEEFLRRSKYDDFHGKIVKLEADLNMEFHTWDKGIDLFNGTFDGQNHTIKNLTISVDPEDHVPYLGFFNYTSGSVISNLRIDNIYIFNPTITTVCAGFIAGGSDYCNISNCYVKNSYINSIGDLGISGSSMSSTFNKCVSENNTLVENLANDIAYEKGIGGIMGESVRSTVKNCAVIGENLNWGRSFNQGPFIGTGLGSVESSYTNLDEFEHYEPPTDIVFADNVVVTGQDIWLSTGYMNFDKEMCKYTMALTSRLGVENWVYCIGHNPLPDCFEDLYPVEVNSFSLRPASLTTPRPNALSLKEEIPKEYWSSGEYRNASYITSSLWIDDDLPLREAARLPIGTATIECTNGVRYDRTLTAPENGTISVEYPVYQTDEEGRIVLDDDGQRIPTGEMQTVEESVYEPTAYSFSLPFPITFSNGIHLYQPTEVKMTSDAEAQVTFEEKADLHAEAWTPYYAIVDAEAISLSTEEHVVLFPNEDQPVDVGNGYYFAGSDYKVKKNDTDDYKLLGNNTWRKNSEDLLPFRSYFYSTNDDQAAYITTIATTPLKNDEDNSAIIAVNNLSTTNIKLVDRTLYKDNCWNTLCLPFDVTIGEGHFSGASAMTLSTSEFDNETGTLSLNFSDASTIEAGTPFIIKWAGDGSNNLVNPVFENVLIKEALKPTKTDCVSFTGFYSPLEIEGEDQTMLYLGADNTLYYPSDAMSIGACRAVFKLNNGLTAGATSSGSTIKAFNLNFGDEESGIREMEDVRGKMEDTWFSLDGRKLMEKPTQKGIYLYDGKKVMIK